MNLRQINWRQPKYIFPAVMAVPAGFLIYFITNMFGGSEQEVATDHINMDLPEAKAVSEYDKLRSMENRYSKDGGLFSAVDGFGNDENAKESLDDGEYSREEIDEIIAEAERKQKEQQQIAEMQNRLSASSSRLDGRGQAHIQRRSMALTWNGS